MAVTGRKPKPTAMKEREGNPGKRPLNEHEPKPKVTIPTCPSWLPGIAKREYKRVAKILVELRVLTEADRTALAAYAHQYAKWREAEDVVKRQGAVITSEKGGLYINPWQNVANVALKNMRTIMAEFGMTPASRSRVEAAPPEEKSVAEELFGSWMNQD